MNSKLLTSIFKIKQRTLHYITNIKHYTGSAVLKRFEFTPTCVNTEAIVVENIGQYNFSIKFSRDWHCASCD